MGSRVPIGLTIPVQISSDLKVLRLKIGQKMRKQLGC